MFLKLCWEKGRGEMMFITEVELLGVMVFSGLLMYFVPYHFVNCFMPGWKLDVRLVKEGVK
jgi:hypothetical protein